MDAMNRAFLYALPGKTALYSIKTQKNLKILKKYGCKIPAAVSTKRRGHETPPKIVGYPVRGLTLSCAASIESTAEGKPSTVLFLRMNENG